MHPFYGNAHITAHEGPASVAEPYSFPAECPAGCFACYDGRLTPAITILNHSIAARFSAD